MREVGPKHREPVLRRRWDKGALGPMLGSLRPLWARSCFGWAFNCGHSSVVERRLPKPQIRVRFPLPAPKALKISEWESENLLWISPMQFRPRAILESCLVQSRYSPMMDVDTLEEQHARLLFFRCFSYFPSPLEVSLGDVPGLTLGSSPQGQSLAPS